MNKEKTLSEFANRHVRNEFRGRFIHEALKCPSKLHKKLCHKIGLLFDDKYIDGTAVFAPDEICLVVARSRIEEIPWSDAKLLLGWGDGVLIVSECGRKFKAESEGCPKTISYGAGS